MILFLVLIVLVLVGLTTAAVLGKIGGFLADATTSQSFNGVPPGRISTQDIEQLHFDQALRGYRMDQVDEVLDALCVRLNDLETEIASLAAPGGTDLAAGDVRDASGEPKNGPTSEPKNGPTSEPTSEPTSGPTSERQE